MSKPLPLPRDWTSTWLSLFVASAMGFLASLGVVVSVGADRLADSWTSELAARATVIVPAPSGQERVTPEQLAAVVEVITRTPGVAGARALSQAEMAALVSPWLGDDEGVIGDLPLPHLIDVVMTGEDPRTEARLRQALSEAAPLAELDAHGRWIDRLRPASEQVRQLAFTALGLVGLASALVVALACSAGLSAQIAVVDVLKLIGAQDRYISRIFTRRFRWLVLIGSGIGVALAVLMLMGARIFGMETAGTVESVAPLLPTLEPTPLLLGLLALVPILFALIATLAARISVRWTLRRREG
ncbi:MAG: cell division protein FtsX [Neomegalonema sp.]|nr:cell division protein FtsX [Neomegalonema sp.]